MITVAWRHRRSNSPKTKWEQLAKVVPICVFIPTQLIVIPGIN